MDSARISLSQNGVKLGAPLCKANTQGDATASVQQYVWLTGSFLLCGRKNTGDGEIMAHGQDLPLYFCCYVVISYDDHKRFAWLEMNESLDALDVDRTLSQTPFLSSGSPDIHIRLFSDRNRFCSRLRDRYAETIILQLSAQSGAESQ